MGAPDASKIEVREGGYTFLNKRLHLVLKELDMRTACADVWETITYTSGLISKVEIFSNSAKTIKIVERTFTRTTGSDGVDYITGMVTIFFNADTSEDSRVTTTITRNSEDIITECANVFSTSENPKI